MPRPPAEREAVKARIPLLLLCLANPWSASGHPAPSLENRLRQDIQDGRLDDFSKIEAAFILSGVDGEDSLSACAGWHRGIVETLEGYRFRMTDRMESAQQVFAYLHGVWLKTYSAGATTLLDIRSRRTFNCVSGTLLFNLTCESLGWSTEAFETPTHVYTVFNQFARPVTVENTSPMGFDIMKNLAAYSRYLVQFYPENRAFRIGLDRLYEYENRGGRPIDNTELLGLLAYNRAYAFRNANDFERAFEFIRFAQMFNRDSRSNAGLEIDLYGRRAEALNREGRFEPAFDVCAEGFRRHPEVEDFAKNARILLFAILAQDGAWPSMRRCLDTALEIQLLRPEDGRIIRDRLASLADRRTRAGRLDEASEIRAALQSFSSLSEN
jgi:tetratricopeptide (TPR) repeat protein